MDLYKVGRSWILSKLIIFSFPLGLLGLSCWFFICIKNFLNLYYLYNYKTWKIQGLMCKNCDILQIFRKNNNCSCGVGVYFYFSVCNKLTVIYTVRPFFLASSFCLWLFIILFILFKGGKPLETVPANHSGQTSLSYHIWCQKCCAVNATNYQW